ncbi:hypothetical protein DdX_03513 [Ditylenchus destructor]|uniref:CX domain-containing protein n=1 Tax=Ditylenchus destructor TaxID=166010 RepID=A0AAD4NFA6_9BILA|nr:hypothetical protein DdX_03513 [Ditylenchus destructor]
MEIAAQRESTGILYEPYHNEFKQCVFEEYQVQGRNERYEFRCDSNLECCGRTCCEPEAATIPLWLLLLFLLLGLLLLLALLSLLWYLCCRKRKTRQEPKKVPVYRPDLYHGSTGGYRSIKHADDDDLLRRRRDSYDDLPNGHGYGNRAYDQRDTAVDHAATQANTAFVPRMAPRPSSFHEEETYEEEFKEEIEEIRGPHSRSSSVDSIIERAERRIP